MRLPWTNAVLLIGASTVSLTAAGPESGWRLSAAHRGDPLTAVATLLEQAAAQSAGRFILQKRCRIVLGYPWSISAVLPWNDKIMSAQGWDAYARSIFHAQTGNAALRIRIEASGYACRRLAFAADEVLLNGLMTLAKAAGWHIAACADLTARALVSHQAVLPPDCRLIVVDAAASTSLFRQGGVWNDAITLTRSDDASTDAMHGVLTAAALMCGQLPDAAPAAPTFVSATRKMAMHWSDSLQWLGAPDKRLSALMELQ